MLPSDSSVAVLAMLLVLSLLYPAVLGVGGDGQICSKDDMTGHEDYYEIFREIGKYGRLSVGDWILSRLCACKAGSHYYPYYAFCQSDKYKTGCDGENIGPKSRAKVLVSTPEL